MVRWWMRCENLYYNLIQGFKNFFNLLTLYYYTILTFFLKIRGKINNNNNNNNEMECSELI